MTRRLYAIPPTIPFALPYRWSGGCLNSHGKPALARLHRTQKTDLTSPMKHLLNHLISVLCLLAAASLTGCGEDKEALERSIELAERENEPEGGEATPAESEESPSAGEPSAPADPEGEAEEAPESAPDDDGTGTAAQDGPASPQASSGQEVVTVDGSTATVRLTGNDQMQYNVNRFEVPAGSTVTLNFEHVGQLPKAAMGHNVVILKAGVDAAQFNNAAMQAANQDYFPTARQDDVIAHTEQLGGGESDTIQFQAPEPGEYDYLCTFPGHYQAGMKGVMVVTEE